MQRLLHIICVQQDSSQSGSESANEVFRQSAQQDLLILQAVDLRFVYKM